MTAATSLARLADAVRAHGPGHPVVVVDLDALDANCAAVARRLAPAGKPVRLVAKSLPCAALLDHVRRRVPTTGTMVFHAPHVPALLDAFPDDDVLAGKPLPVRAAAQLFVRAADDSARARLAARTIWLADTPGRLAQYRALAGELGRPLRVALELELGMHRGGLASRAELDRALALFASPGGPLAFAGFLGYDAHVGAVPRPLQDPDAAHADACARYRDLIAHARARGFGDARTIYDGAGSRTFHRHGADSPLSEVALGSAFVMPARFDGPARADLAPAVFLAIPVLRAWDGTAIPGLAALSRWWPRAAARFERSYFLYGGRWDAVFAWPPGLRENRLYGASYNQTLVNGPRAHPLDVDDHALMRPGDSEAVMLQFDEVWALRGGALEARWPTLPR